MGFFACYLLTPVTSPQRLRCTYVGFTVSPTRRIRQHNGELVNGAKRTTKHRPWEMIVVVHGFPSKFHALQFEYAWQHPYNCRFTKARLLPLKGTNGLGHPRSVKRKLVELHEMLHVAPWATFPLSVTYTSATIQDLVRASSYYQWPVHMTCDVRPLQAFAHCQTSASAAKDSTDAQVAGADPSSRPMCCICDAALSLSGPNAVRCYHTDCEAQCHALCLADHFLLEASMARENGDADTSESQILRPERGTCPECAGELLWPLLVKDATSRRQTQEAQPKKTKRPASKKRRRSQDNRDRETTGKGVNANAVTVTESMLSPAERGSIASEYEDDDAGWFEYDMTAAEYCDVDAYRTGADESFVPSLGESRCSPRPLYEKQAPPNIVDLTMLDD